MRDDKGIDRVKLARVQAREDEAFAARTARSREHLNRAAEHMVGGVPMSWMAGLYKHPPMVIERGEGARFWDIDGNEYLDMNQSDLSASCGFAPEPVVRAATERLAKGWQFLLPTEDAVAVSQNLADRFGLPVWQFTLSASNANAEAFRIARVATGRERILVFGGRYHGMLDETLVASDEAGEPEFHGLSKGASRDTKLIDFNDLAAVEQALAAGDVACVVTEPALTNCGVVLPEDGFIAGLRDLTQRTGALLILDETHTQMSAYGGLTRQWGLEADIVTLGKSVGGGIPLGAYGVTREIAEVVAQNSHGDFADGQAGLATGGTLYANALSMAGARAALEEVLTEPAYERTAALGARLADGLDRLFAKRNLPWRAHRLGSRSGYCLEPELPRNADQAGYSLDLDFIAARKVYLANRGIWDAIATAGPAVSFAHDEADVDRYLDVVDGFLAEIT